MSGAIFTDDSARDARRGLPHSGVDLIESIDALLPKATFLAFMEDGHPADIPEDAQGIEAYMGYRAGGLTRLGLVRWFMRVQGVDGLKKLIGDDPNGIHGRVRGLAVVDPKDESGDEALYEKLFLLVGMSCLDSPPASYQPGALPEVLELTSAVVVFHRDKQGPTLGIYSAEAIDTAPLDGLCDTYGALLVPFAIPPMLARWDRAIAELRTVWIANREEEFPVPPSAHNDGWPPRGRRNKKKAREDAVPEEVLLVDDDILLVEE